MTVKSILISQNTPRVLTPYQAVTEKYGVEFEFRPFFLIEPLTSREFRAQRINILDYTAIVFSSRHAIDAFFTLAEELRCKIPETMKYFCTTEVVAMYLQKHIVYRKRKIFYGTGTPDSVVALIGPKHKGEKFLIATSDNSNNDTLYRLFEAAKLDYTPAVFVKSVSQDLKDVDLHAYDMIVLYNPADVKSLYENFPAFEQGDIKFVSYGRSIVKAMEEAGLSIEVKAPSPEVPSVARAIERYLEQQPSGSAARKPSQGSWNMGRAAWPAACATSFSRPVRPMSPASWSRCPSAISSAPSSAISSSAASVSPTGSRRKSFRFPWTSPSCTRTVRSFLFPTSILR